ncbi:hypothetical protein AWC38_SpisGene20183 [Stylophora pistillata]|uniref:TNFR-Cys domain-containing protein n=1 Tax=Stylophora pistillata TaxID=50429 RepID=A0A2B4REL3_STYPI|nr:hypothetical protein AWC38_SpisGene20183 [Stylophora pistillata]
MQIICNNFIGSGVTAVNFVNIPFSIQAGRFLLVDPLNTGGRHKVSDKPIASILRTRACNAVSRDYYFLVERCLVNRTIEEKHVRNLDDCKLLCYQNDNCVSLNYKKDSDTNPKKNEPVHICKINNATHLKKDGDLTTDANFYYRGSKILMNAKPLANVTRTPRVITHTDRTTARANPDILEMDRIVQILMNVEGNNLVTLMLPAEIPLDHMFVNATLDILEMEEIAQKSYKWIEAKEYPFLHAPPDFLTCCDCCGLGCGEVKCPLCIQDANFEDYAALRNSCLVTTDGGGFKLKRSHNYYFQVQQQLFTLEERNHNDFIVYAIDNKGNAHLVMERILPDVQHWDRVLPKLKAFWRICVLPDVLGRWYTRWCMVEVNQANAARVCREDQHAVELPDGIFTCSDCRECPPGSGVTIPCGSKRTFGTPVECKECATGYYSDSYSSESCKPCSTCSPDEVTIQRQCTSSVMVLSCRTLRCLTHLPNRFAHNFIPAPSFLDNLSPTGLGISTLTNWPAAEGSASEEPKLEHPKQISPGHMLFESTGVEVVTLDSKRSVLQHLPRDLVLHATSDELDFPGLLEDDEFTLSPAITFIISGSLMGPLELQIPHSANMVLSSKEWKIILKELKNNKWVVLSYVKGSGIKEFLPKSNHVSFETDHFATFAVVGHCEERSLPVFKRMKIAESAMKQPCLLYTSNKRVTALQKIREKSSGADLDGLLPSHKFFETFLFVLNIFFLFLL